MKKYQKSLVQHMKNILFLNVIADHIRMLCFSIADGAIPSNDGEDMFSKNP